MTDGIYVSTHKTPVCGFPDISKNGQPQCQTCGVEHTPGDVYEPITEYRGFLVCKLCRRHWDNLEKKYGVELPVEAFCSVVKRREYLGARNAINTFEPVVWVEEPDDEDDTPGEETGNPADRPPDPDGTGSEDVPLPKGYRHRDRFIPPGMPGN